MNPPGGTRWVLPRHWDTAPQLRLFYCTSLNVSEKVLDVIKSGGPAGIRTQDTKIKSLIPNPPIHTGGRREDSGRV